MARSKQENPSEVSYAYPMNPERREMRDTTTSLTGRARYSDALDEVQRICARLHSIYLEKGQVSEPELYKVLGQNVYSRWNYERMEKLKKQE